MKKLSLNELRSEFLKYFASKGHTIVPSSSLIPHNDPTLLFTNAGMNQFKDVFLGFDKRNYVRAVSSQKCVRAGGKHNDLENVGYTARHHTFFEMLGNFSFGDYFKHDAIKYAWEFLTEVLKLPKEKLYVTVYHTDDEAFSIWHEEIGLDKSRIIRIGDRLSGGSDNFWQMGDTGPCGPCTEIFYDHGAEIYGGLPGSEHEDGDRYIEIWNCVFMQFNRDEDGNLHPLPKPSVDTGMGLERIAAVMQNVHSNYEVDLFVKLIDSAAKIANCHDKNSPSLKVLADHIRSVGFLIADGAIPANEGRGYVLRRIIRRAIRHGYKLGARKPFFYQLIDTLVSEMGDAYSELVDNKKLIEETIYKEELGFFQTLESGMTLITKFIDELRNSGQKELSGEIAFKLYDTYGFPLDLTQDILREINITVDVAGFEKCMQKQKHMARAVGKFKASANLEYNDCDTAFLGYLDDSVQAQVIAIYKDNQSVQSLTQGEEGVVVLDRTVFYAESGGQVGDSGIIQVNGGASCVFVVNDTQKIKAQVFGHIGSLKVGKLSVGDTVEATYDMHIRLATARNHSVTHLLHKALHEVVGTHATQRGSLVNSDYTRFDFANDKPVTLEQLVEIERIVNHVIMMNYPVSAVLMNYNEAIQTGAMALFGEKYDAQVRVIKMGDFSTELCGGTHVSHTGDIGYFKIISESGIANGVRRIEAITGEKAVKYVQDNFAILSNLRNKLKAQSYEIVVDKVDGLLKENKELVKTITSLRQELINYKSDEYLAEAKSLTNGNRLLVLRLDGMDAKAISSLAETLKNKQDNLIVVLASVKDNRVSLAVGVSKLISKTYNAGSLVHLLAQKLGGKGGGRADLAQAGAIDVANLDNALQEIEQYILILK